MGRNSSDGYNYYQYIGNDGQLHDTEPSNTLVREEPKQKPVKEMIKYHYSGPIKYWDKIVINKFEATTMAVSEAKAKQNILFRAKKELGLTPSAGGVKLMSSIEEY